MIFKNAKEDWQMDERWVKFQLKHIFPENERVTVAECVCCFTKFRFLRYDE